MSMTALGRSTLPQLCVASDQPLVAQSIRAALADRGYEVVLVRWPDGLPDITLRATSSPPPTATGTARHVLVVVCELDQRSRILSARHLLVRAGAPGMVLCGTDPGPGWGAVLEVGAAAVVSSTTTLDALTVLITRVAGGRAGLSSARRRDLVAAWRRSEAWRVVVEDGMAALTARECEVLELLHAGRTVRDIAARLHTSEATVRSQVKAVLRKLRVDSQLSAVAAYETVRQP